MILLRVEICFCLLAEDNNNALALPSIGCHEVRQDGFNPTLKIKGKLYHRIGNLLPNREQQEGRPKFTQFFFHNSDKSNEL